MKILIADDDAVTRKLLESTLEMLGDEIIAVDSGDKALAILEGEDAPRIAILDWMMPGMDGTTVCRRLRAEATLPATYIVLLTSRSDRSDIIEGLDAGADDYLTKPFHPEELRARLQAGKRVISLQASLLSQLQSLQNAFSQIKTLHGLLPICCHCKKIRTGLDYWQQIESYITQHSNAAFTHGICPECVEREYPEEDDEKNHPEETKEAEK